MSELRDQRLDRLEEGVREIKAVLGRLEPLIVRIDERLNGIDERFHGVEREMGHLATNAELAATRADLVAELADKPGKLWLTTAIGVLLGAYAGGLAALAALPIIVKLVR